MKLSQELVQPKLQQDNLLEESIYSANAEITGGELEEIVSNLGKSLEQARQFVREEEEELTEQIKIIVNLEAKLQSARDNDRQLILKELVEEKEIAEMLETTLIGQRNNLQQQESAYRQYTELLHKRRKEELKNQEHNPSVALDKQSLSSNTSENHHFFSATDVPTFNFLSLGQQGVGKTAFLAGCYAQYSSDSLQKESPIGLSLANALQQPTGSSAPLTRTKTFVWQWVIASLGVGMAVWFALNLWLGFSRSSPRIENNLVMERQIQEYEKLLRRDPNDFKTLEQLTTLYLEQGKLEAARPLMEKIVKQNPEALQWQLNLATLYELTENWQKAEKIYDQILSEDNDHFQSLLRKAYLRRQQGDFETAKSLFQQAERVAISGDLKAKVREMAQQAQTKSYQQ